MRLTGANLGIGTTGPTQKLHLNSGVLRISGGGNDSTGEINLDNGTEYSGNSFQIRKESNAYWGVKSVTSGNDLAVFVDNTVTLGLYIKNGSGNVGIGTTVPVAKLEISSSTAASLLNVKGAGGNGLLFVSGSGLVGIGTTAPRAKLHIGAEAEVNLSQQTVFIQGTKAQYASINGLVQNQLCVYDDTASTAGAGGGISFGANTGASQRTWIASIESRRDSGTNDATNYAGSLVFYTRPAQTPTEERMRITSAGSGNVILTNTPNTVVSNQSYIINVNSNVNDADIIVNGESVSKKTNNSITVVISDLLLNGDTVITLKKDGYFKIYDIGNLKYSFK
jgi:hypothetical protein